MCLVQTSARGKNIMDAESFSLLESDSTMPHRGIALPPLTWYFCIDFCRAAAAFSIHQHRMNHHPSSSNLNLFFPFLSTSPYPRMFIKADDRSGLLLCLSSQLTTNPVTSISLRLNPHVVVCHLLRFDYFWPPGYFHSPTFFDWSPDRRLMIPNLLGASAGRDWQ